MIKTLFIPAKVKSKINKEKILEISKKLPKNIVIAYSIQYEDIAKQISSILKSKQTTQVLGCTKLAVPKQTQAILLIGSGRFHATSLAYENKLPIYILEQNELYSVSKKDIEAFEMKQKASYSKFLHSDRIGIFVSTKLGQQKLKEALGFKKKLTKKNSYIFISNNINTSEFENFDIDSWVNTACPRLDMDASVINMGRLKY